MTFLTPAFLAGLGALAVPLLVHLAHSSRGRVTRFPSLLFLQRIPFRTKRRRALRHPLLFALRCGAVVLLVLAFARPAVRAGGIPGVPGQAREVVLLLDQSFSMGYGDRWERAMAGLRRAIDGLAPADRASVVTFAARATTVVPPSTDREELRAALDGLEPGAGVTRYEPAFRVARRILDASELNRRDVILATDFQAVGWRDRERLALPPGTHLESVDVSDAEPTNLAITEVTVRREAGTARTRITARVYNGGQEAVSGVEVALEVNDRTTATQGVGIEARSATSVVFTGIPLPEETVRGRARLAAPRRANGLLLDDTWHFVLAPEAVVAVRLVEGRRGRADRSLYLKEALEIGDMPPMRVNVGAALRTADLTDGTLVILNDAPLPGGDVSEALRRWLESGGGLLVVLGPRSAPGRWSEMDKGLLPAEVADVVDRTAAGGGTLASVAYDHAAFELFRAPRSGDLSGARFLRYRRLKPKVEARVVARFDDGLPALVEGRVGAGRVLLWASTLDRFWNDLALQPVFLPLVQRLAVHAAGYEEPTRWLTVGQVLDVGNYLAGRSDLAIGASATANTGTGTDATSKPREQPAGEWVLESPEGTRRVLRFDEGSPLVELASPGMYRLRRLDAAGAARPLAVNLDPAESDLTVLDREELLTAAGAAPTGGEAAGSALGSAGAESRPPEPNGADSEAPEPRRELWWGLLAGAAVLLATEAVVANGLSRRRVPGASATPVTPVRSRSSGRRA